MLRSFLHCSLLLVAQTASPFALWQDIATNQYSFVTENAAKGVKTNIAAIPGLV